MTDLLSVRADNPKLMPDDVRVMLPDDATTRVLNAEDPLMITSGDLHEVLIRMGNVLDDMMTDDTPVGLLCEKLYLLDDAKAAMSRFDWINCHRHIKEFWSF